MLFSQLGALGFVYVACSSHVDPLRPPRGAVSMVNYPADWLQRFSEQNYAGHDPIFATAKKAATPFYWDALVRSKTLCARQQLIIDEAASLGLAHGLTVPIHSPGALPASCSLVPGIEGFDRTHAPDVFMIALYAHETARTLANAAVASTAPRLTKRERECLALAGRGKSDWDIGKILGVSARTVHNTLERAKQRYGVAHRVQAVVKAVFDGQIVIDDLTD